MATFTFKLQSGTKVQVEGRTFVFEGVEFLVHRPVEVGVLCNRSYDVSEPISARRLPWGPFATEDEAIDEATMVLGRTGNMDRVRQVIAEAAA